MTVNLSELTTREVAQRLGVTVRHVHYLCESGRLTPARQLPGPRGPKLFSADDVERLATEQVA
jgi:excisionase family DNA binding protein